MQTLKDMLEAGTKPSNKMVVETAGYDYETWVEQTATDNENITNELTNENDLT